MHRIEYILVRILIGIFQPLPFWAGKLASRIVYFIVRYILRYRRQTILSNVQRVYGDQPPKPYPQLIKEIYLNFVYLWMEFLQFPKYNQQNFRKYFHIHNEELVHQALAKGKGVIFITGHLGNFEIMTYLMPFLGHPFNLIMKKIRNPLVNALIVGRRTVRGSRVFYTFEAMKKGLAVLKNGEILGIAGDQDAHRKGIFVHFLGQPSSTAAGTAVFWHRTGAELVFCSMIRSNYARFEITFEKISTENLPHDLPALVQELTERHTAVLEKWVRAYPEQYFWMHRRWKTKPA
jgi:KDO2-lipid IV(A) lauroyltransferase